MTDQAAFERLATAILREAEPRYARLLHSGVNKDGKTVKAPVDGIGFVPHEIPAHMVIVQHTTCRRRDLEKKWLHIPRADRGRGKTFPGDCIKSAEIALKERMTDALLKTTLVLTTNQEPSEDLVRKVHAFGRSNGLEIDIWSASRLGHFLDHVPTGQWLRKEYLGVTQERLSPELLLQLSRESLRTVTLAKDEHAWVATQLDTKIEDALLKQRVLFILAESGFGKSVACYKKLSDHISAHSYGLVVPHAIAASSPSVEHAVDATLRQFNPSLANRAGSEALALCSADSPMLLVVEDINKSFQPAALVEKIASWDRSNTGDSNQQSISSPARQNWRILCPVWPQVISSINEESRKRIEQLAITSSAFTTREGGEAARRRASYVGVSLSVLDAELVSQALGNDPLLIALHEPTSLPHADRVISSFIDASAVRVAVQKGQYTASDYRSALRRAARAMLEQRQLQPRWEDLLEWLQHNPETITALRHLVHDGEVVRLSGAPANQKVNFRHDRVRDVLFSDAVVYDIQKGSLKDSLLSEPYFAEVIGAALLLEDIPLSFIEEVRIHNPLALFHALRRVRGGAGQEFEQALLRAIDLWLADPETHTPKKQTLRWCALDALAHTESGHVLRLVRSLKTEGWKAWEALMRNGNVSGALSFCSRIWPGSNARWHEAPLEHARLHFGGSFAREIAALLQTDATPGHLRVSALRLAGFLSSSDLSESIEISWRHDPDRDARLAEYLWATAQCCGDNAARYLAPICDAWAALPSESEGGGRSDIDSVAAYDLRWSFRRIVPSSAISFFVERAQTDDALRWPIFYMLHGLDHPTAVEFVVREIAQQVRALEGTESFSPFAISAPDDWVREQEENGNFMSPQSRSLLHGLWNDRANDKHLRQQALRLWAANKTATDLDSLRTVEASDEIADTALRCRLERGDLSAVPHLSRKLEPSTQGRSYWWHFAPPVWCDEMMSALVRELEHRRCTVKKDWFSSHPTDFPLYTVIMELPTKVAEKVLLDHWDHLHLKPCYVQAAFYFATPRLLQCADQTIASCPNPEKMFEYIDSHYGIKNKGRRGVTTPAPLLALSNYVGYLGDLAVYTFWELCNENGWFDLRRRIFDPYVDRKYNRVYLDDDQLRSSLDEMLAEGRGHWLDHWLKDVLRADISTDRVLSVVRTWLMTHGTPTAHELASDAIVQIGKRRDLQILDDVGEPSAEILENTADATFALKRRSLI